MLVWTFSLVMWASGQGPHRTVSVTFVSNRSYDNDRGKLLLSLKSTSV